MSYNGTQGSCLVMGHGDHVLSWHMTVMYFHGTCGSCIVLVHGGRVKSWYMEVKSSQGTRRSCLVMGNSQEQNFHHWKCRNHYLVGHKSMHEMIRRDRMRSQRPCSGG